MRIIAILLGPLVQLIRLTAQGYARHWRFAVPATAGAVACAWFGYAAQAHGFDVPYVPVLWGVLGGWWIGLAGRAWLSNAFGERHSGGRPTRPSGDQQTWAAAGQGSKEER